MSFLTLALTVLAVSACGSLIRVVIGPTVWDRLLGFGLAASKITLAVVITAVSIPENYLLDLAMLLSMLGFLVTVLLARYIERRGIV